MNRIIIIAILVIAFVLRLSVLGSVPPSVSLDEASIGYNAYSILHTGMDEYGNRFPLVLRAYDDFRPGLYAYTVIPFIWLFGLTAGAVRLPSVLFSLITVYMTYRIGKLLGEKHLSHPYTGAYAAGILAISPWHIYISRLGHEANLGFFLITAAVLLFVTYVYEKKTGFLIFASAFLGLSIHAYQSQKMVAPLLIATGIIVYGKEMLRHKREAVLAGIIFLAFLVPAVSVTVSPEGMTRFRGTSAFSEYEPQVVRATEAYTLAVQTGDVAGRILNGKAVTTLRIFSGNYLSHFSPVWLFTGGRAEAFKTPGLGLMYVWEAFLLIAGGMVLVRKLVPTHTALYLAAWVLVSIFPAAVTTQAPHAMRAYTMLVPFVLLESLGLWYFWKYILRKNTHAFHMFAAIAALYSFSVFVPSYFTRYPDEQSVTYQYALGDAVAYASAHADSYASVQFSHQGYLYQSYMFFLYYTAFDPVQYLKEGGTQSGGYEASHTFGKFAFGYLPQDVSGFSTDTLYFYDINHVPPGADVVERFSDLSGETVIAAVSLP